MNETEVDQLRRKLATVRIMFLAERDRCAKAASVIQTGALSTDKGKWEHESLLREMILYDQDAQIIEAIEKSLV